MDRCFGFIFYHLSSATTSLAMIPPLSPLGCGGQGDPEDRMRTRKRDPLQRSDSVGVYGGRKRFSILLYPLQMLFRYISTPATSRAVDGDREVKVGELLGRVVRSACLSVLIHYQAICLKSWPQWLGGGESIKESKGREAGGTYMKYNSR
jgi:hypothetical protein